MTARRPWRAAAYARNSWQQLEAVGHVAGKTWPGIRRWVRAHQAQGHLVQVWEVLTLPGGAEVATYREVTRLS